MVAELVSRSHLELATAPTAWPCLYLEEQQQVVTCCSTVEMMNTGFCLLRKFCKINLNQNVSKTFYRWVLEHLPHTKQRGPAPFRVASIQDIRLLFLSSIISSKWSIISSKWSNSLWNLNVFPTGITSYPSPSALHSRGISRIIWSWPQKCTWIRWHRQVTNAASNTVSFGAASQQTGAAARSFVEA